MPKNYQISQFDFPVGVNGSLEIVLDEELHSVEIERVHMEEDTEKVFILVQAELILQLVHF